MINDLNQLRQQMKNLGGLALLPQRLLHHRFPSAIEHLGALTVRAALGNVLRADLPSLGIRSDFCLVTDSGTIGQQWKSCRDSMEFMGIRLSTPQDPVRESNAIFEASTGVLDGRAEALSESILNALAQPPWLVTKHVLRACLAIAGADGQYAKGEQSMHHPNECLALVFHKAGRRSRVGWDGFHRVNKAGVLSMRSSDEATELFSVLHDLHAQFGYGQGRSVARAVADIMGVRMVRHRHGGGTRKFIYLSQAVESLLSNFAVFVQSVRLRKAHAESEDRTGKSNQWWANLGKRITELSMLMFLLFFRPAHGIVVPYAFELQSISALEREPKRKRMYQELKDLARAIEDFTKWLPLLPFIYFYLPPADFLRYVFVVANFRFRCVPELAKYLPDILVHGRVAQEDVVPEAPEALPEDPYVKLHRACQCGTKHPLRGRVGRKKVGRRFYTLPHWVAQKDHIWKNDDLYGVEVMKARLAHPPTRACSMP